MYGHMLSASIQLFYILIKPVPTQCEGSVQSKCHGSPSSRKGENKLKVKNQILLFYENGMWYFFSELNLEVSSF